MRYIGPNEPTEQEYRDARSAVNWLVLSVLFLLIATIAQIVWFIMLLMENGNPGAAFVVMIGAYVLHFYCKWCSDDVKPENWK